MASYQPGRYWGKVTNQQMGTTRKGNPQFVLTFLIVGKVDPTNPGGDLLECPQYERSVFRVITDNTIDFMLEDLQALGYDKPSFKYLDPNEEGFVDFADKELEFFCTHETYEGKVREKWGIARGTGGAPKVEPLDSKAMRKLDAMFGRKLKEIAAPTAAASPTNIVGTPATVPCSDDGTVPVDDIPF